MKEQAQVGDYIKAVGGLYGVVKTNRGWKRFECVNCARALGYLTGRRLQNDPVLYQVVMERMEHGPTDIPCGGAQAHRAK